MVNAKFKEHWGWIYEMWPEFGTPMGFFAYTFSVYLIVLFFGWLLNPTVDEILENDIKQKKLEAKGKKMRKQNLDALNTLSKQEKLE